MKFFKFIIYALAIGTIFSACSQLYQAISQSPYRSGKAANTNQMIVGNTPQPTRTPRPTNTLIPTATVDYQQTAEVAQATADEARRINAAATAQYEALINQQLQMTQVIEQQEFAKAQWTAMAASTVIPLTATQQAIVNTQVPAQQQIMAAILTSTKEAPTQVAAMAKAANEKEFGARINLAEIVLMFSLSALVLFVLSRMVAKWIKEIREERQTRDLADLQDEPDTKSVETVVQLRTDKGNGSFSQQRLVLPCTPDQFNRFAIGITQLGKSMAINQWEKKESGIGKPVIVNIRNWAAMDRDTAFVTITKANEYVPTEAFINFLGGWLDTQLLPDGYEFELGEAQPPSPTLSQATPKIIGSFA